MKCGYSKVLEHVFVPGGHSFALRLRMSLYLEDDYNNPLPFHLNLINTKLNVSESNYPNTVLFYHYTSERSHDSIQLYIGDERSLKLSQFNPKKPTVIITHGWQNNYLSPPCVYIRGAYARHGDYNIIVIDWGALALDGLYTVADRVQSVAKYASKMLDFLVSQGMDPSTTTIIGHSFGAHVAGLASYYAKNKVNYIVGLDPAGPGFRGKGKGTRLSKDDANYVQAIHTTFIFGTVDTIGHADFYVNGGLDQVGCSIPVICGHIRSYEYFTESISSKGFVARKCDHYAAYQLGLCNSNQAVYMGGIIPDQNAKGTYYLNTNPHPPFAKN
nr:PREDICTED: phospholipase A1-like [Megachile rotundata]